MLTYTRFKFIFIFFLYPSVRSNYQNFCKTPNGDVGKCISDKKCPQIRSNYQLNRCNENLICCPAMQKIVTPIGTNPPNPVNPTTTTAAPSVTIPIVTLRPKPTTSTSTTTKAPSIPVITMIPRPLTTTTTTTEIINTTDPIIPRMNSTAAAKCEEYRHRVKKRASIVTYVFGGTASLAKEFPHMAILGYGTPERIEWLCGGSLISEQFVLTAAHCLITQNLGELMRIRLGDLDLQSVTEDARPEDFGISQKIVHPNYQLPSQYNDIALLKMDREVKFSDYIAPICLQTERELPNYNFIATGWGRTELGGSPSDILMKVDLDYFPNDVCRKNYENVAPETLSKGIVDDTQICAGSFTEEKDTCQGDSGGPLQIKDGAFYIVGVTSFGKECGVANNPAVYTRVSYYVPWIEQIVWSS